MIQEYGKLDTSEVHENTKKEIRMNFIIRKKAPNDIYI
jgi:hypothetical protein